MQLNLLPQNAVFRSSIFDGYNANMSSSMKLLITRHLQTMDQLLSYSHSPRAKYDASVIFQLQALARHRSLRLLEEKELAEKILSSSSSLLDNQAAILEISLGTHLDRTLLVL